MSITGACAKVQISSRTALCTDPAKLLYSASPNGIVMFTIILKNNVVVSFVGDRDSQPSPENYTLYLSRVRVANSPAAPSVVNVAGKCDANISKDATIFYGLVCKASSMRGDSYLLSFRGDGKPVAPSHLPWGLDAN